MMGQPSNLVTYATPDLKFGAARFLRTFFKISLNKLPDVFFLCAMIETSFGMSIMFPKYTSL